MKDLLDMKIGEEQRGNGIVVLRVPNGWVYSFVDGLSLAYMTSTFVPETL
tara:strand:+ start:204 stop:353 length:150 start_codon:yes stop_codon:yes gene_type:complete